MEKLPEFCYSTLPSSGETIIIKKGEKGYYKTDIQGSPDMLNETLEITKSQKIAMEIGSLCGWDVEGCDPNNYDENGKWKK